MATKSTKIICKIIDLYKYLWQLHHLVAANRTNEATIFLSLLNKKKYVLNKKKLCYINFSV